MRIPCAFALCLAVLSGAACGQTTSGTAHSQKVPAFEDFRVPTPLAARQGGQAGVANHVPDFEKELRETAKDGPDFAGHLVIEQWTCGSTCTGLAIVNVVTGEIYWVPFSVNYFCPHL
jgi:hypothetical protein